MKPPMTPEIADQYARCENCRHWSRYMLSQGSCDLPRAAGAPVQFADGGSIDTHPNHYCAQWTEIPDA